MKTTNDYIISGGEEGKARLNTLSDVLYPTTTTLLANNGVRPGIRFLDAGCGGGNVARMVSEMVGEPGGVTAIDFDAAIIELNKKEALDNGVANISYQAMSAYDMDFDDEFDVVFARFLLTHLTEPGRVLERMLKSVKPGGRILVEDVHFSGHFCYPASEAFDRYISLYTKAAVLRGHNPEIGPSLPALFTKAGIADIGFDVIQPAFSTGSGKWMAYVTMDKIKDSVIAQGLATAEEVGYILSELEAFTKDESTVISLPRIVRVWGVRN